jgi:hypothetical protein
VSPVVVQVSASVSAERGTADSTSVIPDTSTGAMVSPATNTAGTSAGTEPTASSGWAASANAAEQARNRVVRVPGSRARPYTRPATRLPPA